jgi:Aspartyl/Asparaginyl beta-hydroxylase
MMLNVTHKQICRAPSQLCDDVRSFLASTNWKDGRYNRTEKTLKAGYVIEMPYAIKAFYQMTPEDEPLRVAAQALVDWINTQDGLEGFEPVRGEIASLVPGARLEVHYDMCWFHNNSRRLHIPLITNENCWHYSQRQGELASVYHMDQDCLYELNNRIDHTAANEGKIPRVHLIVDFMPRGFLDKRLAEGVDVIQHVDQDVPCEWLVRCV